MGTTDLPPHGPFGPQHEQWDAALLTGLVGPYGELFETSPSFHHAINHLRAMLPAMVSGLATSAKQADGLARMYTERLVAGEVDVDEVLRQIQEAADGGSSPAVG